MLGGLWPIGPLAPQSDPEQIWSEKLTMPNCPQRKADPHPWIRHWILPDPNDQLKELE